MGGRFLSGMFWGGLVSAVVVVNLSLLMPLEKAWQPEGDAADVLPGARPGPGVDLLPDALPDLSALRGPDATSDGFRQSVPTSPPLDKMASDAGLSVLSVPAGSEFRRARPDMTPALPETDTAPVVPGVSAPEAIIAVAPPQPDTAPLAAPSLSSSLAAGRISPVFDEAGRTPFVIGAAPASETGTEQEHGIAASPESLTAPSAESTPRADIAAPRAPLGQIVMSGVAPDAPREPLIADLPDNNTSGVKASVSKAPVSNSAVSNSPGGTSSLLPGTGAPTLPIVTSSVRSPEPQPLPAAPLSSALVAPRAMVQPVDPSALTPQAQNPQLPASGATQMPQPLIRAVPPLVHDTQPAFAPSPTQSPSLSPSRPQAEGPEQGGTLPPRLPAEASLPERMQPSTERLVSSIPRISLPQGDGAMGASAVPVAELSALSRNAAVFAQGLSRPLLSIIMIDVAANGIDRATLGTLPFPVTFAVDPRDPDALAAVEFYRGAGFEVLLLATGLPEIPTPLDVQIALAADLSRFGTVIGVLDVVENGFAQGRDLARYAVTALKENGHAMVVYDTGLNPAKQLADTAGLASTIVFRVLDDPKDGAASVNTTLNKAVLRAAQQGAAVVVAHSYVETVAALFEWAAGDQSGQVVLAPVSALLGNR
jgi:polysaccharide deacetylase 2 family uncharacterized protein YibQ